MHEPQTTERSLQGNALVAREPPPADALQTPEKRTPKRRPLAVNLAFVFALVAASYIGLSVFVADRLTRPIRRLVAGTPADVGMPYESIAFTSQVDGIPLKGWWIPSPGSDRAIVMVHGRNSTRSGDTGSQIELMQGFVQSGYNVLTFDLRAHGESGGTHYTLGLFEQRDLLSAIAQVRGHGIAAGKIGLWGLSLGAVTSLLTTPKATDVAAVVADSSYARLSDMLNEQLPNASHLPSFFSPGIIASAELMYSFDVDDAVPETAVVQIRPRPIFFIHSDSDTFIPPENSRRLWRTSGETPDMLWTVVGPEHGNMFGANSEEYLRRVTAFFRATVR